MPIADGIELLDETLREGDSRSYRSHSPAERIAFLRQIHDVTGIKRFCLGWAVVSRADRAGLLAFLEARRSGHIPADATGHLFGLPQTDERSHALLASMAAEDRACLSFDFAIHASESLARVADAPWLVAQRGKNEDWRTLPVEELRRAIAETTTAHLSRFKPYNLKQLTLLLQDAFRCELDELDLYIAAGIAGGATEIRLHDTVGIATPTSTIERVRHIKAKFPKTRVFLHCHNDFGMATACALSGLEAGVDGVDVTVNGIGNRSGNACTAEVLMALKHAYGVVLPSVKYERLTELSRAAEAYFGLMQATYAPVTGRLLFLDEATPRTDVIERHGFTTYLPYAPEDVGAPFASPAHGPALDGESQAVRLLFQRRAAELSASGITPDAGMLDRAVAWVSHERTRRGEKHRSRSDLLMNMYEDELRASYVTDDDIVARALLTRGGF